MSTIIKKFITLKGSAVDCYYFAKRETGWSDEKLWDTMLLQLGMSLGMESRKLNQRLFEAIVEHAESQREILRMQIAATKQQAANGPRGRGRPIKIP